MVLIYLLTAIGLAPGGSSSVHIYTKTIHRTIQLTTLVGRVSGIRTQNGQTKINDEVPSKNYRLLGRVHAVPRLCELYSGICLTNEKNHGKKLQSEVSEEVFLSTLG